MVTSLFPQNLCVVLLVLKANWCKGDYWTDCHSNKPDSCEVGHYPTSSNRYSPWAWNEYFCLAFWQEHYLCVSCPAGKSSPEGKECKACVPGRYSDLQNLDLCKPCIAGYYQDDHYNTGCKQCGLGQYQNDEAMHHCKICPPGHFQAAVSQSSCNSCAMGQYQNDVGQTSCKFCSKGVYQDQTAGSGCKDCEPGKYQESIGQRRCKKCGRGRFSDSVAANSIEYCHYCTESGGKFSPEGSTSCTDCEAGLFMAPNVPEDERNACRFCPAGYFQKERGKPDCQKCPSGYHKAFSFHSAQDHVACKACPGGYYAEETGLGACKKCGLGRFSSSWALTSNCELCPSGKLTYDSTGQTECKNCPVGTFLPEMLRGRRDCLPCNNNAEGATTCNGCEPGKWGHGDFGCNRCEDGKFSTGGMSSGCKDCPMGYYSKARNQIRDECLACVGGFYSETERANSSRVCIACRKGRFGSKPQGQGDSEDCIDCPAGRYANATGLSNRAQCLECPLGRRSSIEGLSSECEECKSGRFSSVIGKHTQECNRCPPGKMQNMTGQALCIECPKGYYQDLFEERECLYCPRGWHQRSSGMVRCEPCSPGYYQPKPGESFCTECTPGRINSFTALADKCIKCEKGKFMENFRSTATECDKCPGGYFQSKEGQTSCLPCGVGRFRAENSYASECQECPGGFFQSSFGSTDCDECQAGRYQSIPGQLSCIKCIPGQFSSAKKQRECEACPEGWFQVKSGSRNCSVPTQGTIALPGGTGVSFIAQGWHGTNCSDTMCRSSEPCPPGTRFVEGDFSCVTCEPGKWSSLSSLICRDCEKGKFAPMAGMSECQICNEDDLEYADEEGLTKCKVCEWDERSTRFNCEKIGFDPSLPLVIGRPFIHRIARNESNLWDDSSKRAVVLWEGLRDKQGYIRNPLKPTELQLQLSTDPEFLVNTTLYTGIATDALKFFPPTPIPISNEPLCDRIIYARLRSAYNVLKTRKYGMWSQASESWRSTGSNDCARPSQYLDCSISHKPLEWSCKECPKGAVCETPETTSVRWNQVHSASGYWRDNRVSSMTRTTKNLPLDLVPRNFMFVKCVNDKSSASMCPEGEIDNNGRVRETCGLGYLNICDKATNSSCRLCRTCDQGYVMISFGSHFICKSCSSAGSEDRNDSLILIVAISSIVLFVYGLLVFLKIKSSTMNQNFRTKAAHSTIKRILLTHMQVVMLSIGLNVPWPSMILSMLRIFAAISSINQHVDELGCYLDMGEAVGKQSRFLYWSTTVASLFPIAFTALLWIYWVLFVPLPCCGCLACGRKTHLTLSDPVPNFCRKCCGGKSSNHGREYFKKRIEDTMSKFNEKKSSVENPISTIKIEPPQILASDQNYLENTADDSLSSSALANEFAKRREVLLKKILEDQRLKTRDIWVYSTVLFLYMLYPSLCQFPLRMMSCMSLHLDAYDNENLAKSPELWMTQQYLRIDPEEICYGNNHTFHVLLIALPSFLMYALGLPMASFLILWRQRGFHKSKKYIFRMGLLYSGYTNSRWWWECVVVLRKLSMILIVSMFYDDKLQLQITLGMIFLAFALHHIFMPFDVNSSDNLLLHILERNSILVCCLLLWSASVFMIQKGCETSLCYILALATVGSNVVFLSYGCYIFISLFLKHTKIVTKIKEKFNKRKEKPSSQTSSAAPSVGIYASTDTGGTCKEELELSFVSRPYKMEGYDGEMKHQRVERSSLDSNDHITYTNNVLAYRKRSEGTSTLSTEFYMYKTEDARTFFISKDGTKTFWELPTGGTCLGLWAGEYSK